MALLTLFMGVGMAPIYAGLEKSCPRESKNVVGGVAVDWVRT